LHKQPELRFQTGAQFSAALLQSMPDAETSNISPTETAAQPTPSSTEFERTAAQNQVDFAATQVSRGPDLEI
jgi:hypothetical protein